MSNFQSNSNIIGVKQTVKTLKTLESSGKFILYIAEDADAKVLEPLENLIKENSYEIKYVATMQELGELCGIDVGATAAIIFEE